MREKAASEKPSPCEAIFAGEAGSPRGVYTRILITGVKGFAGSHLAHLLAGEENAAELYGSSRPSKKHVVLEPDSRTKLLECDVMDRVAVEKTLEKVHPDIVFHSAAFVSVARSFETPVAVFETNTIGTMNILEGVKKICKDAIVLLPGSAEVYGHVDQTDMPIKESQALNPRNPYGLSKACQEMIGQCYSNLSGLKIYFTRTFHYTGPGQPTGFVCSDFAKQIVDIERGLISPILRVGNLKARRDFLDIRDVVRSYWEIVRQGRPGVVYNVCRGSSVAIEDVLTRLIGMSSVRISVEVDSSKLRPIDVPDFVGDNTRLRHDTHWTPQISLDSSLCDVLDFWRAQG